MYLSRHVASRLAMSRELFKTYQIICIESCFPTSREHGEARRDVAGEIKIVYRKKWVKKYQIFNVKPKPLSPSPDPKFWSKSMIFIEKYFSSKIFSTKLSICWYNIDTQSAILQKQFRDFMICGSHKKKISPEKKKIYIFYINFDTLWSIVIGFRSIVDRIFDEIW